MQPEKLTDTLASAAAAITGLGTPEAIKAVSRDSFLTNVMRNLAGPAISVMVSAVVAILSWGIKFGFWTSASEDTRATYVGMIGIALSIMLGVALWVQLVGRPSRMEVKAGPGSVIIDSGDNKDSD